MHKNFHVISVSLNCIFILILMYIYAAESELKSRCIAPPYSDKNNAVQAGPRDAYFIEKQLVIQRNTISKKLNQQQKKIGELQCKVKDFTSESGAYCYKEAMAQLKMGNGRVVFEDVAKALQGQTVASFGEGPGYDTRRMIKTGLLARVDSYDGNPFCNETAGGRVQFLDLSVEQYGLPVYDWIMSIEVAEHIPSEYEHIYLDNIARHAKKGVLISWAIPGQPGVGHINCRSFEYVNQKMRDLGFEQDKELSNRFKKQSTSYLKQNMNAFVRVKNDPLMDIFR